MQLQHRPINIDAIEQSQHPRSNAIRCFGVISTGVAAFCAFQIAYEIVLNPSICHNTGVEDAGKRAIASSVVAGAVLFVGLSFTFIYACIKDTSHKQEQLTQSQYGAV